MNIYIYTLTAQLYIEPNGISSHRRSMIIKSRLTSSSSRKWNSLIFNLTFGKARKKTRFPEKTFDLESIYLPAVFFWHILTFAFDVVLILCDLFFYPAIAMNVFACHLFEFTYRSLDWMSGWPAYRILGYWTGLDWRSLTKKSRSNYG